MKIRVYFFPALKHNIVIMKMKFITAIVAFSITFGFSAFLTNLLAADYHLQFETAGNNRTGQQISAFLRQDIENGRKMDTFCKASASLPKYSEAVNEYVETSEALEDVNFPPDFRFAWQAHMKAWRSHADFLESHYSRKDFYEQQTYQIYSNQTGEINRTWLKVLDIGKKYGAVIPSNAY